MKTTGDFLESGFRKQVKPCFEGLVGRVFGRTASLVFVVLAASIFHWVDAHAAVFSEQDRQAYQSCASDANEAPRCTSKKAAVGENPRLGKVAGGGGQRKAGSNPHWECLNKELNRCLKKKGVSADARKFIKSKTKQWRMFSPKRTRLPAHEDILQHAVGKELDRLQTHVDSKFVDNRDFKACVRQARKEGLSLEGGVRISREDFMASRDTDTDERLPMDQVREALIACRDERIAERERSSNPTPDPTPTPTGSPTPTTTGSPASNSAGPGSPPAVIGITPVFTAD